MVKYKIHKSKYKSKYKTKYRYSGVRLNGKPVFHKVVTLEVNLTIKRDDVFDDNEVALKLPLLKGTNK